MAGVAAFPTTHWTAILAKRDSPRGRQALLDELLGAYWRPVYVYLRAKGRAGRGRA
jgi:RNA polymerase sigma-70 factor (ECF subfamily)